MEWHSSVFWIFQFHSSVFWTAVQVEMACKEGDNATIPVDNPGHLPRHPPAQPPPPQPLVPAIFLLWITCAANLSWRAEPLQLSKTWVSTEECQHCLCLQLCFYCAQSAHSCAICPVKPGLDTTNVGLNFCPCRLLLPKQFPFAEEMHHLSALVNSGSAINLIHCQLVDNLHLPTVPCTAPLKITAMDNQHLTAISPIRQSPSRSILDYFM